jgi:predicted phosphodiesterase
MKKLIISFIFFIPFAFANKNFNIMPYTLKADNGDIHLKFETLKKNDLKISILRENEVLLEKVIKTMPNKLVSINLGQQSCGEGLSYTITNEYEKKLISRDLPPYECHLYDEFTFGLVSDTQSSPKNHEKVAKAIYKELDLTKINFIIHTGDITHMGGEKRKWEKFFDVAQSYLAGRPLISAIGNHSYWKDKKHRPLPELFKKYMRWEGSKELGQLNIVYPLFQLVILNSTFEELSKLQIEKQLTWLLQTLKEAHLEKRHVIVAMHYPPFSSSLFSISKEAKYLRENYVPLFEKYGVKLVLTGHTHIYERSFKDGVHYLTAGPAGGLIGLPTASNPYSVKIQPMARTFSTFKVTKDQITIKTLDHKNKEIDGIVLEL